MKESRVYSFLDNKNSFNLHFLEGSKIIKDLSDIHNIGPNAIEFYRDTVLTSLQMLYFVKPGENLGFYIDREDPYFRYKIEMNFQGTMRTLLLPEDFKKLPEKLNGVSRLAKILPNNKPYTSLLKMEDTPIKEVVNNILRDSYQTNSKVFISDHHDQSLMITKLPPINVNKENPDPGLSIDEFVEKNKDFVNELFQKHSDDVEIIVNTFESYDFDYLGSKEVKFFCPCSKEGMIKNLLTLHMNELDEIFSLEKSIEIRCDYCNTLYVIDKDEIENSLSQKQ